MRVENAQKFKKFTGIALVAFYSLFHFGGSFAKEQTSHASLGFEFVENKAELPLLNPSLQNRTFAKIRLTNGLRAYLISDPGADQSAAALAVEAGSWQDPSEYPGMAHFLEHMLFMGTKAYPKEHEYMQYIGDHGGIVNAATWPDRTVYMFSINNPAFEGALDRFSHFFIDPLFSRSCIDRELHAVDQEHAKNIENDPWREYMIFKESGNPSHPNAAFSTGNAQTLSGIPQAALQEWYERHYAADRMYLVIISPLPLETLSSLVSQDFSKIKTSSIDKIPITMPMASDKQKGHITYIKPIKDLKKLSLVWEIPEEFASDMDKKNAELIAYALKNEGPNSLLEELKREKIADALDVEVDRFSLNEVLLRIDISLTTQGLSQIETATLRCFQAIAKFKQSGIPSYLFEEMKKLATINYQYQSREDAFSFVMRNAHDIVDEGLNTYPEKTLIPTTYDPISLKAFLEALTPQSCLFFLTADPASVAVHQPLTKEKWMGAEYVVKEIPPRTLLAWSDASPHPHIGLPLPNPFIPNNLLLVGKEDSVKNTPFLIANDDNGKVYFAQDHTYLVPELSAIFS
ncbi:MAG: insulinase family protein, partial [Anaerolineae bacterium]